MEPLQGATQQDLRNSMPVLDTRTIVKRHMEDPNHVITDDELQQVVITTEHINISDHPIVKAAGKTGR